MRFLLAGVLLMVGCGLMAATTVEVETGRAVLNHRTRGEKAVGCLLAITALCLAAWRTSAEKAVGMTFVRHPSSDEEPVGGFRVVRDDEVPF